MRSVPLGLPEVGGRSPAGLLVEPPAARSVTPERLLVRLGLEDYPRPLRHRAFLRPPGPLEKLEVRPVGESGAINEELRAPSLGQPTSLRRPMQHAPATAAARHSATAARRRTQVTMVR